MFVGSQDSHWLVPDYKPSKTYCNIFWPRFNASCCDKLSNRALWTETGKIRPALEYFKSSTKLRWNNKFTLFSTEPLTFALSFAHIRKLFWKICSKALLWERPILLACADLGWGSPPPFFFSGEFYKRFMRKTLQWTFKCRFSAPLSKIGGPPFINFLDLPLIGYWTITHFLTISYFMFVYGWSVLGLRFGLLVLWFYPMGYFVPRVKVGSKVVT